MKKKSDQDIKDYELIRSCCVLMTRSTKMCAADIFFTFLVEMGIDFTVAAFVGLSDNKLAVMEYCIKITRECKKIKAATKPMPETKIDAIDQKTIDDMLTLLDRLIGPDDSSACKPKQ